MNVAFLGLGMMGSGMAARISGGGFPLAVWNRSARPAARSGEAGARVASSPADAARDADVVFAMVADDQASRAVWTGPDGALAGARAGAVLVECSTLSPGWIDELAAGAGACGCTLVDAPVTGSRSHAERGELLFLAGGDAAAIDRVEPILRVMGRDVARLGPLGSGARMKLVNNFVCGVQAAALAEGLVAAEAFGLDRQAALAILANGAPGSPLIKAIGPRMTGEDATVSFKLALMRKDLAYAAAEGARHGVRLGTAESAMRLFDAALDAGLAEADFSAVIAAVRARTRSPGKQPTPDSR